jgi:hypothetical protein
MTEDLGDRHVGDRAPGSPPSPASAEPPGVERRSLARGLEALDRVERCSLVRGLEALDQEYQRKARSLYFAPRPRQAPTRVVPSSALSAPDGSESGVAELEAAIVDGGRALPAEDQADPRDAETQPKTIQAVPTQVVAPPARQAPEGPELGAAEPKVATSDAGRASSAADQTAPPIAATRAVPRAEAFPGKTELVIEARVRPQDIANLRLWQAANIRLTALSARVTPMVSGVVIYVSADTLPDEKRVQAAPSDQYVAGIRLNPEDAEKIRNFSPLPGMPAEVYIKTSDHTFFEYLLKPLRDSMQRAFREM